MKFAKNIFIIFILLLKTKASAINSLDTTTSGTDKSQYITNNWHFDNGASVKGFVSFTGGFTIAAGGTLNYESCGIVSGSIYLNGGTLNLTGDMYCGKLARIYGPGTINGSSINSIYFLDVSGIYGGKVNITGAVVFVGMGTMFTLDLASNGALHFNPGANFYMHNIRIQNANTTSFMMSDSVLMYIDNSSFEVRPDDTLTFSNSSYQISAYGINQIVGPKSKINLNSYLDIQTGSRFIMNPNTTLSVGTNGAIAFNSSSSDFVLNGAALEVGTFMQFRTGRFVTEGASTITGLSGNVLDIGSGLSISNDCNFFIAPGSTLELESGTEVRYRNIH